jgi:hypothetical protein
MRSSSSSHKPLAQLTRVSSVNTPRVAHSSIHVCWLQVQPGGRPCWSAARGPTAAAAAGYSHDHERHCRGSRWQVSCAVLSWPAQLAASCHCFCGLECSRSGLDPMCGAGSCAVVLSAPAHQAASCGCSCGLEYARRIVLSWQ